MEPEGPGYSGWELLGFMTLLLALVWIAFGLLHILLRALGVG